MDIGETGIFFNAIKKHENYVTFLLGSTLDYFEVFMKNGKQMRLKGTDREQGSFQLRKNFSVLISKKSQSNMVFSQWAFLLLPKVVCLN